MATNDVTVNATGWTQLHTGPCFVQNTEDKDVMLISAAADPGAGVTKKTWIGPNARGAGRSSNYALTDPLWGRAVTAGQTVVIEVWS